MAVVFAALPEAARAKAAHALAEAFPGATIQSLIPLHGGLSGALVYKLIVDGRPFVMRIIEGLNPFNNPLRQFTCMQLAAQQSIAPQVYYTSDELGVSITAYIEHQSAMALLQHDAQQIANCGELLCRLHSGPDFPVFPGVFEMIQEGVERLTQIEVRVPSLIRDLLAEFEPVKQALQPHLTLAPCHNDLNPGNVLYDGRRLWLVDWEGACMGDPMYDLASLIHWFVLGTRQEAALLTAYFQRIPNEYDLAKLTLMKQVAWCFHTIIFFLFSLEGDGPPTVASISREHLPSFAQALKAIGTGELRLQDADARQRLSLIIANQSLDEMHQPAFKQALGYLAER